MQNKQNVHLIMKNRRHKQDFSTKMFYKFSIISCVFKMLVQRGK